MSKKLYNNPLGGVGQTLLHNSVICAFGGTALHIHSHDGLGYFTP